MYRDDDVARDALREALDAELVRALPPLLELVADGACVAPWPGHAVTCGYSGCNWTPREGYEEWGRQRAADGAPPLIQVARPGRGP